MEMTQTFHGQKDVSLRKRAALISLLVGIAMLVIKMSAYLLTHSAAILSDALESVVHIAATTMAFYSVIVSARPPDDSHPYGHGKVEFFSAGMEGSLIAVAALVILYEAIRGMIAGRELASLDVGIYLTAFAALVNLLLGWYLVRQGNRTTSLTLIADGKHVLTDSYTSFGVIAGLALVTFTGIELFDPLVAIAVALNILVSGYNLVRISVGGLMDESDVETLTRLAEIVNRLRTPEWINLHHLRVMRSGQMHHIDFHLTIPYYWTVEQSHSFQQTIETSIRQALGLPVQILIHLDPCSHFYCKMCRVSPCPVRQQEYISDPSWDVRALVGSPPHSNGVPVIHSKYES
jgi:cation diffusion facilitator family transporter